MSLTRSQQRAVTAFDVEIQAMLERLRGTTAGTKTEVYMTPTRLLYSRQHSGAKHVGTYNRRVPRGDFWDDCHSLATEQGWDVRPISARATPTTHSAVRAAATPTALAHVRTFAQGDA